MSDGGAGSAVYEARADIMILGENPLAVATAVAAVQGTGHRAIGPVGYAGASDIIADGAAHMIVPVSYTHLDVYKRQPSRRRRSSVM